MSVIICVGCWTMEILKCQTFTFLLSLCEGIQNIWDIKQILYKHIKNAVEFFFLYRNLKM